MTKPKISIITVVFNNVRDIGYTLRSVADQTYTSVEYIVIDGLSTDGTLDVIEQYRSHIDILISEKDNGIYDAMNKGLRLATGDYVLFLNSGDELYESTTLEKIFSGNDHADIYYGETKLVDEQRNVLGDRRHKTPEVFTWKSFKYGMNVCHQAIYVRRELAEPYDTQYQLSADIDWVIRAAKKARHIVNAHCYVAKYLVGGMSQQRHRQSLQERYRIFSKYYGAIPNLINHGVIAIRLLLYRLKHGNTKE
ncbi:glycosyltransferase involved in cell wall biosynthesis [Sphingobacterium allocomposti]|uniref:Glycosyltransferase involved in cell wall biosynthesis n=1 Tax=Sphingobacterium allocomposti TaxID=415956 RepID=A0A5S5D7B0_9SPHI|nr:glycosyltransferase family 2 protein [Sphingobacterium composti Yoo et al. 2007 non Ten et al. 2007]TYP91198.1 glycosyltransferase involved in cell wall biosynthesis [Sphingobacterium composti Yoo et al. 2007 non Ten et al. 2007]HLS94535.1 glycosyltransferase family 2 protein [Sphingobacterium sp.]